MIRWSIKHLIGRSNIVLHVNYKTNCETSAKQCFSRSYGDRSVNCSCYHDYHRSLLFGYRMINSLISHHRLKVNLSCLRGLKIVFLKGSVLDLLLSFVIYFFLTIVAIWIFKHATGNLLSLYL